MKLVLRDRAWQSVLYTPWKRALRLASYRRVVLIELLLADAALGGRDTRPGLVILDERAYEATGISRVNLNHADIFRSTAYCSFVLLTVQAIVLILIKRGLCSRRLALYQISILVLSCSAS